jgi:glycerophosphoryl diester phosphodiesterase
MIISHEKLVSHRIRGFGDCENSIQALINALDAGVRRLEIDIRITKDNNFVVFHDPFFKNSNGKFLNIHDFSVAELANYSSTSEIPTLEHFLEVFVNQAPEETKLYIDIKSAGFEEQLVNTVKKYNLMKRIVWVSWIPTTLIKIYSLSPKCNKLCYTHITFARFPPAYFITKNIVKIGRLDFLKKFLSYFLPDISKKIEVNRLFFDDKGKPANVLHDGNTAGCNYKHFVPDMITEQIKDLLIETQGMICIPTWCVNKNIVKRYHDIGIKVAVYSVKTEKQLSNIVARALPDLLYVDNASLFTR